MLDVGGQTLIDRAVNLGREAGVEEIVANTHYLPNVMEPTLRRLGVEFRRESPDILETGGGLKALRCDLTDPTITLNPDALFFGPNPIDLLLDSWDASLDALLLLVPIAHTHARSGPGDFSMRDGVIKRGGPMVYTGAQIIRTERLDRIRSHSFSLNVFWDQLLKLGGVKGVTYPGEWCDVGTPDALETARTLVKVHDV